VAVFALALTAPVAPATARPRTDVAALLAGIPQTGPTLGYASAPVTVEDYSDLECPICADLASGTLPKVITRLVRTRKVKLRFRSLQTATESRPVFLSQQTAALAAGRQHRLWQYVFAFYAHQATEGTPYVDDAFLLGLAEDVPGLDIARWQQDRRVVALSRRVKADLHAADLLGFNSTPTLVADGPRGAKGTVGNVPYSTVAALVRSVGPATG
jgi:protein-disulfide isomerase